ncbi:MAG: hypothetical protein C0616_11785 [Desulfuromonas sp.]|nr:MAG: hypothetical protein C0616_11785 [Desulfuromonas sp.]
MCLEDGPYLLVKGDEKRPLDQFSSLIPLAGKLKLIDLFGKTEEIDGEIEEIDLMNRRIVLTA